MNNQMDKLNSFLIGHVTRKSVSLIKDKQPALPQTGYNKKYDNDRQIYQNALRLLKFSHRLSNFQTCFVGYGDVISARG